jgi:hypothetical protein
MKDAKSFLLEVSQQSQTAKKVAPLYAEDRVVELPFLHSIGIEPRYKGHAATCDAPVLPRSATEAASGGRTSGRNTRSRRHDDKPQDLAVVVQKNLPSSGRKTA